MITILRSWRLWLALALVVGAIVVVMLVLDQSRQLGEYETTVETLNARLSNQQEQHQKALKARDAALVAERVHARQAQDRADSLAKAIDQARASDADIDACMAMPVPAGIAERLRE